MEVTVATTTKDLLQKFMDMFAWNYKELRGIPPHIVEHKIELDTIIPPSHQTHYRMNLNYATVIKQDLDKLLVVGFIQPVEQATWLSLTVVVLKKNNKLHICIDFWKLNTTTKKDLYPSPFTNEALDKVVGHEVYSNLDGFSEYHQIQIAHENRYKTMFITNWGTFIWVVKPFGFKNAPPTYQRVVNKAFKDYLDDFMKLFLDDFMIFNDLNTHLSKLRKCFKKCREYEISFNPKKCAFMVLLNMVLRFIVSKEVKLPNPKKVEVIVKMPVPKNAHNIQVFNGLT